jgi:hypothetical protein
MQGRNCPDLRAQIFVPKSLHALHIGMEGVDYREGVSRIDICCNIVRCFRLISDSKTRERQQRTDHWDSHLMFLFQIRNQYSSYSESVTRVMHPLVSSHVSTFVNQ